jgi:hypothetical protein
LLPAQCWDVQVDLVVQPHGLLLLSCDGMLVGAYAVRVTSCAIARSIQRCRLARRQRRSAEVSHVRAPVARVQAPVSRPCVAGALNWWEAWCRG